MTTPRQIGRYTVREAIASGAQGAVYRAIDPSTAMTVAVKVLIGQHIDDVERMRREASLVQAIDHQNVVKLIEVGESEGQHFMVMEFIPETLSNLIKITGALPVERAVTLAIGIADGLGQAHAQGIVHHDIKPQNILLTAEGIPKVTDFGIARGEMFESMTSTGWGAGSLPYISPEQIDGKRGNPPSDVYSLGCMLYELLAGEVPFSGSIYSIMRSHKEEQPEPLRNRVPGIPDAVARCVEQAMAKDRSQRYADGNVFSAALRRALASVVPDIPEHVEEDLQAAAPARSGEADEKGQTRLTSNLADDSYPSRSSDGSQIAFFSWRDGNAEIYVMNADGSNQTRLTSNSAYDCNPSWSTDGSKIAFVSYRDFGDGGWSPAEDGESEIYVMDADGSNQTRLTNNSAGDWEPSWSPDGSKIAFSSYRGGNAEIYVMDADGSNQTRLTNSPGVDNSLSWSPDGSKIAFTSKRDGNAEIYVMDAGGSNQTRITGNPAEKTAPWWRELLSQLFDRPVDKGAPSWSPDGSKIAFSSDRDKNREIYVMNAGGSNQTRLTSNDDAGNWDPSWSPDGSKIAFMSDMSDRAAGATPAFWPDGTEFYNYDIYVMDADGSDQIRLTSNSALIYGPSWSLDGSKIAFSSDRDGNWEIWVVDADGSNETRLTSNSVEASYPNWGPAR